MPFAVDLAAMPFAAVAAGTAGVLVTGLLLGIRHGFDWDHIAAITDITSTTADGRGRAASAHADEHRSWPLHEPRATAAPRSCAPTTLGPGRRHPGASRSRRQPRRDASRAAARRAAPRDRSSGRSTRSATPWSSPSSGSPPSRSARILPDWVDPIMGRVVGLTLVLLGVWVFVSLYQYARHGTEFRLRSRWMLVFDGVRYGWRRLQARLHGHEHVGARSR